MSQPPANQPPASPYETPAQPVYGSPYDAGHAPSAPRNGMGTSALVLGIIGLVLFWTVVLGIILGVLALIFGIIGRRRASRREATNGGVALAGAILGGVALVGAIIVIAAGAAFYQHHKSAFDNYNDCVRHATTQQELQACRDQFSRDLTNNP
jgi:hypothetical protein